MRWRVASDSRMRIRSLWMWIRVKAGHRRFEKVLIELEAFCTGGVFALTEAL
jgi:hypothetical protein